MEASMRFLILVCTVIVGANAQNFSFPCCGNYLGDHACREYEVDQQTSFRARCVSNDMFKFFGCCRQCRVHFDRAFADAGGSRINETRLFTLSTNVTCGNAQRWNRRGDAWCQQFASLGLRDRTCNTTTGYINCRRQCGFCEALWYNNATVVEDCPVSFPVRAVAGRRKREVSGVSEWLQLYLDEEEQLGEMKALRLGQHFNDHAGNDDIVDVNIE